MAAAKTVVRIIGGMAQPRNRIAPRADLRPRSRARDAVQLAGTGFDRPPLPRPCGSGALGRPQAACGARRHIEAIRRTGGRCRPTSPLAATQWNKRADALEFLARTTQLRRLFRDPPFRADYRCGAAGSWGAAGAARLYVGARKPPAPGWKSGAAGAVSINRWAGHDAKLFIGTFDPIAQLGTRISCAAPRTCSSERSCGG
jgi:hypothetical protein